MAWLIFLTVLLATLLSLILVPIVRALAHQIGMEDRPDKNRKLHRKPIALGGGIAVLLAVTATFVSIVLYDRLDATQSLDFISFNWYILFGAAGAMLLVGLIDDVWSLRGRQKLLFQLLIISAVVGSGTVVKSIGIFGFDFHLDPYLGFPITILWLVVAVNALNLIDGADGMATTAGCIISAGLACLSLSTGNELAAIVGFALSGALIGFLCFNRPPATIFLGDAGSMTIGLFIGVLAVWCSVKESTAMASAPIAVLAIPLFDSTAAIVRRWLTGRSIYATDRGHLHHLLQEKFGSTGMLVVVAVLCTFTSALAVISAVDGIPMLDVFGVLVMIGLLVFTRSFGHAECRLILGKSKNFAKSFLTHPAQCEDNKLQTRVPLQGTGDWDVIWDQLVEFAKGHELAKVRVDLNVSWLQEGYHATWNSVRLPEKAFQLVVRLPLFCNRSSDSQQVSIGILEIVAPANDPTVYKRVAALSEMLVALSPAIDSVVAELEAEYQAKKDANQLAQVPPSVQEPEPVVASNS